MRARRRRIAAAIAFAAGIVATAHAAEPETPVRPKIVTNRWQEDWSVLSDPQLRTQPLDGLKYIALSDDDPHRYLSLGATLRERFEYNDATGFGASGLGHDAYLIQRLQVHADLHFNDRLRLFAQFEDDRAYRKQGPSTADKNPADLRLAFLEYVAPQAYGTFKFRVGRQDFAFDLQRFVSSRDGPNVRQSFDAVWADWEWVDWRVIAFVSQPVQYKDQRAFDDTSTGAFQFHTVRVERHVFGQNELSAYYSFYDRETARFGDATGHERRHIVDARFAGTAGGLDWDGEVMLQSGSVGAKSVRAWGTGSRLGYSWTGVPWKPRLGVQFDAASGDKRRGDDREGTFNPLFPNGYYFSLGGYTGYANLIQVKPSMTLKPTGQISVTLAEGLLWRQTTADAVYTQPNIAVANTAGIGSSWTGRYAQVRADYAINPHLSTALEAVHYQVGNTLRSAGGHDSSYLGIEMKASW